MTSADTASAKPIILHFENERGDIVAIPFDHPAKFKAEMIELYELRIAMFEEEIAFYNRRIEFNQRAIEIMRRDMADYEEALR